MQRISSRSPKVMRAVCPASMSWMPLAAPVVTSWPRFSGRPRAATAFIRKAREAAGPPGSDEGAPGLRAHYHANYYGAYVRDAAGNKLCVYATV